MPQYKLDELVLGDVLRHRSRTHSSATFLRFRDGEFTYAEVDTMANRMAQGLRAMGVDRHDHVAVMLPNCPEFVFVVLALAKLGAVVVPINTAYKGELLRHVLDTSDTSMLVVDDTELLDRFAEVAGSLPDVTRVAVRTEHGGTRGLAHLGVPAVPLTHLLGHGADDPHVPVAFSDLQAIMFTSGTTGPSKGVLTPHALPLSCALDSLRYVNGWGRTYYCPVPLFHAGSLWDGVMSALLSGSEIAIVERFSASRFWDDIRHFDANVSMGVFTMIPILLNQPPRVDDLDNPLETFYLGKSSLDEQFYERFGAHPVETYTSTEAGIPTGSPYGQWRAGSCGTENSHRFEVRVVDEHDREVRPGVPGELVVRPRQPYVMITAYYGHWKHTTRVFRNQWFHTGDQVYRDDDGYFYFLDRMKDAIRRRGENISAYDIEQEVNLHPGVLECAAIGVPSELEEDEVKVAVVLQPGADPSPTDLVSYCQAQLPSFMVPRYVEFVDELPRTPTGKLAKHHLREMGDHGITAATWDREAARGRTGGRHR